MGKDADGCCEACKLFGDGPPVDERAEPAALLRAPFETVKVVVSRGTQTIAEVLPTTDRLCAGRAQGSDIVMPDCTISKRQFQLVFGESGVVVTDTNRPCGTFINGHRTSGPTLLREGATIHAGDFTVRIVPRS